MTEKNNVLPKDCPQKIKLTAIQSINFLIKKNYLKIIRNIIKHYIKNLFILGLFNKF